MEGVLVYLIGLNDSRGIGHGARDAGCSGGSNGVDGDSETVQLQSKGQGESDDGRFGGRIVRLAEVADEAGTRTSY